MNSLTVPLNAPVLKVQNEELNDTPFFVLTLDLGSDIVKMWINRVRWFEGQSAAPEAGETLRCLVRVTVKMVGGNYDTRDPGHPTNQLKLFYVGPVPSLDEL